MDAVTRQYFSGRVTVDDRDRLLTPFLNTIDIRDLAAAPDDSEIEVLWTRDGVLLKTRNRLLQRTFDVLIYRTSANKLRIQGDYLVLDSNCTGQGIGTRAMALQMHGAKRLQIEEISGDATGNVRSFNSATKPLRGYYVWPMLGYEANISQQLTAHAPLPFRGATLVSQLMVSQQGRAWWKQYGDAIRIVFHPQDPHHWTRLQSYLHRKGIQL